jgi:hypothetical protein
MYPGPIADGTNRGAYLELLPLDDPRWGTYRDGYNRAPYDVVSLIRRLHREGTSEVLGDRVG